MFLCIQLVARKHATTLCYTYIAHLVYTVNGITWSSVHDPSLYHCICSVTNFHCSVPAITFVKCLAVYCFVSFFVLKISSSYNA
jgi:hypothetical protein